VDILYIGKERKKPAWKKGKERVPHKMQNLPSAQAQKRGLVANVKKAAGTHTNPPKYRNRNRPKEIVLHIFHKKE
jgi:hypothetical protein